MKYTLTPDERAEFDDLLADVAARSTKTSERTDLMLAALRDAEQAQRSWATQVLSDALRDGVAKMVKDADKRSHKAGYKAKSGNVIDLSAVSGVKRDGEWHQLAFEQLNRHELEACFDLIESQLATLGARKGALTRLSKIYDRHPEAPTLAAALDLEHLTLDAVLAEAA